MVRPVHTFLAMLFLSSGLMSYGQCNLEGIFQVPLGTTKLEALKVLQQHPYVRDLEVFTRYSNPLDSSNAQKGLRFKYTDYVCVGGSGNDVEFLFSDGIVKESSISIRYLPSKFADCYAMYQFLDRQIEGSFLMKELDIIWDQPAEEQIGEVTRYYTEDALAKASLSYVYSTRPVTKALNGLPETTEIIEKYIVRVVRKADGVSTDPLNAR